MALSRKRRSSRPGGFTYDTSIQRYRAPNGKLVSATDVRTALDEAIAKSELRARALGAAMADGEISATAFYREMRTIVKSVHLYSAASAVGGWAQMTQSDYGRVGQIVRGQYAYLNNFAAQIAGGLPMNGAIEQRAGMYAQAGRMTHEDIRRELERGRGRTHERNILHPADHCGDCVAMRDRGRVPIGTLIPLGKRQCKTKCRCTIEYS